MAARVRTIAEAIHDLTAEIRAAAPELARVDLSKLDGRARETAKRMAGSLDAFTRELEVTNRHLQNLARLPILGVLGGGAEAEIQRLCARVDALRAAVAEVRGLVPR